MKSNIEVEQMDMNFFFWLGEDGEMEFVDEATFQQRQRDWKGDRPSDFDGGTEF